jgi:putative transposase
MPDYRRNRVPGEMFLFTVNLLDRRSNLLLARIDAPRNAVRQARAHAPFHIDAWVVLPDKMYRVWTLPQNDANFPGGPGRSRLRLRKHCRLASRDHRARRGNAH